MNSSDLDEIEMVVEDILAEFDPKTLLFIDAKGQWKENPSTVLECTSHELLFFLWCLDKKNLSNFVQKISFMLNDTHLWSFIKKIRHALLKNPSLKLEDRTELEVDKDIMRFYSAKDLSKDRISFLILFEVIVWSLVHEVYRINSQLHVPYWDRETRSLSLEYKDKFQRLDGMFKSFPGIEDKAGRSVSFPEYLKDGFPDIFNSIPTLIAEEDMITISIDLVLSKTNDSENCEVTFSMILQKIQGS